MVLSVSTVAPVQVHFFFLLILSNIQVHFASHFDEVFDVAFAEKVPGQL